VFWRQSREIRQGTKHQLKDSVHLCLLWYDVPVQRRNVPIAMSCFCVVSDFFLYDIHIVIVEGINLES